MNPSPEIKKHAVTTIVAIFYNSQVPESSGLPDSLINQIKSEYGSELMIKIKG